MMSLNRIRHGMFFFQLGKTMTGMNVNNFAQRDLTFASTPNLSNITTSCKRYYASNSSSNETHNNSKGSKEKNRFESNSWRAFAAAGTVAAGLGISLGVQDTFRGYTSSSLKTFFNYIGMAGMPADNEYGIISITPLQDRSEQKLVNELNEAKHEIVLVPGTTGRFILYADSSKDGAQTVKKSKIWEAITKQAEAGVSIKFLLLDPRKISTITKNGKTKKELIEIIDEIFLINEIIEKRNQKFGRQTPLIEVRLLDQLLNVSLGLYDADITVNDYTPNEKSKISIVHKTEGETVSSIDILLYKFKDIGENKLPRFGFRRTTTETTEKAPYYFYSQLVKSKWIESQNNSINHAKWQEIKQELAAQDEDKQVSADRKSFSR